MLIYESGQRLTLAQYVSSTYLVMLMQIVPRKTESEENVLRRIVNRMFNTIFYNCMCSYRHVTIADCDINGAK